MIRHLVHPVIRDITHLYAKFRCRLAVYIIDTHPIPDNLLQFRPQRTDDVPRKGRILVQNDRRPL